MQLNMLLMLKRTLWRETSSKAGFCHRRFEVEMAGNINNDACNSSCLRHLVSLRCLHDTHLLDQSRMQLLDTLTTGLHLES